MDSFNSDDHVSRPKNSKPAKADKGPNRDELEMGNIFTEDKNNMELLQNLNSIKLLAISEQFNMYPDQTVTVEEFIEIMLKSL